MRWPSLWTSSSPPEDDDVEEQKDNNSPTTTNTRVTPVSSISNILDALLTKFLTPSTPSPSHLPPPSSSKQLTEWSALMTTNPYQILAARENIAPTVILTGTCLAFYTFYRSYLRRISVAGNISPSFFRRRSIVGRVTSVGDGDNFRIFHTPGGRLAGWGWLPWRKVPRERRELKDKTIHVRLAGVDAPELAHFGRPSQPHSQDALAWLKDYVLNRRVRAYVYKRDQYDRVVATVYVWNGLIRRDVGLQMLRAGMATVYEAKSGAEFGVGLEEKYRKAEWWAKWKKKGIWAGKSKDFESPREYKTRHGNETPVEPPKGKRFL